MKKWTSGQRFSVVIALLALTILLLLTTDHLQAKGADQLFTRGESQMADRNYSQALKTFAHFLKAHPQHKYSEKAFLYQARAAFLAKKYQKAHSLVDDFLKKYPDSDYSHKAQYLKAGVYVAQKKYKKAASLYEAKSSQLQAPSHLKELAGYYLDLAKEFYDGKKVKEKGPGGKTKIVRDYKKALKFYSQASEILSQSQQTAQLHHRIAFSHYHSGQLSQAVKKWEMILKRYPKSDLIPEITYRLGQSYFKKRDYSKARKHLLEIYKNHRLTKWLVKAQYLLGKTHRPFRAQNRKELDKALSYWKELLKEEKISDENATLQAKASFEMAKAYYKFGAYQEAIDQWKSFRLEHASHKLAPQALYQQALCHQSLSDYQMARSKWKKFLSLYPNHELFSKSLNNISLSYYREGREHYKKKEYEEAVGTWKTYIKEYPLGDYASSILYLLGAVHYQKKEYKKAVDQWTKVARRFSGKNTGARAQYSVAQTYLRKLKDLDRGVEALEVVIEKFRSSSYARKARRILKEMRKKLLRLKTKRSYTTEEKARVHIEVRNISELTFRIYNLDLKEYFAKKHHFSKVEDLMIEVVAPDAKFTRKVPEYKKYQRLEHDFDLTDQLKGPGAYIIAVEGDVYKAKTLVLISNITLITKHSPRQILAFAQDELTGKPMEGLALKISDGNRVLTTGKTSEKGIFSHDYSSAQKTLKVFASQGKHYALSPARVKSFTSFGYETRGYLYTDRPVYRPGQKVHFKGIVREVQGGEYKNPAGRKVRVTVRNNKDLTIYEEEHSLSEFGSCADSFNLTSEPPLGKYTIFLRYREKGFGKRTFQGNFYVEEYKKPEFDVRIDSKKTNLLLGEKIEGQVQASYYFGGPLANSKVKYRLYRKSYSFDKKRHKSFSWFYEKDKKSDSKDRFRFVRKGEGKTDKKGRFNFSLNTSATGGNSQYLLEVKVRDMNRRWASSTSSFYATDQGYYALVRSGQKFVNSGEKVRLHLITVAPNHSPVSQKGKVEVVRRSWQKGKEIKKVISKTEIMTDEEGRATTQITMSQAGEYFLRYKGTDRGGNTVTARAVVFVRGKKEGQKARLVADKSIYREGDVAKIMINSPVKDAYGLVTFEGEKVLDYEIYHLKEKNTLIEVPLKGKFAPNVTISLALAKGHKLYEAEDKVMVFQFLNVSLKKKKGTYKPGEEVTYEVVTTDQRGQPVQAEVSLAVVDESVYAIRPDHTPSIKPYFYNQRRKDAVVTASSYQFSYRAKTEKISSELLKERTRRDFEKELKEARQLAKRADRDKYRKLGMMKKTESRKLRRRGGLDDAAPSPKSSELKDSRGGGRGATFGGRSPREPSLTGVKVRRKFADTAYWKAQVKTDEKGRAEVKFQLPDNLTTWRVTARGVSGKTLVGEGRDKFVTTKDFLVRLETPRFLTEKDEVKVSSILHNRSDKKSRFESDLKVKGAHLKGGKKVSAEIEGREEKRLDWKIVAKKAGWAKFTTRAVSNSKSDGAFRKIPVLPHGLPHRDGFGGKLAGTTLERITLPQGAAKGQTDFKIHFTPGVQASFLSAIEYLRRYPYGCMEQTVNRFLPALAARKSLVDLGIDRKDLKNWLDEAVRRGVIRLSNSQNSDGGWGWWRRCSSRPVISAYVYLALAEAKDDGYRVDSKVLRKARYYFSRRIRFSRLHPDTRALVTFALSRDGYFSNRFASLTWRHRHRLSPHGLSLLALAYHEGNRPAMAQNLVKRLLSRQESTSQGTYWKGGEKHSWFASSLEATSYGLQAVLAIEKSHHSVSSTVDWIMAQRRGGYWQSTKATGAVIMALAKSAQTTLSKNFKVTVQVTVNGSKPLTKELSKEDFTNQKAHLSIPASLLKEGENEIRIDGRGHSGRLYYTGVLSTFVKGKDLRARGHLLKVKRRYIAYQSPHEKKGKYRPGYSILQPSARPKPLAPKSIEEISSGQSFTVLLEIEAKEDLEYVVLEDLLPAGVEVDGDEKKGKMDYMEVRDEKAAFFFTRLPEGKTTLQYTLVAVAPGNYHALPARAYPMYEPQISGNSRELKLQIGEFKPRASQMTKGKETPDEIYEKAKENFKKSQFKETLKGAKKLLAMKLRTSVRVTVLQWSLISHLEVKNRKEGVKAYEKLTELNPSQARLNNELTLELARSYRSLGEDSRALHFYKKVIRTGFQREMKLARVYRSLGRPLSAQTFTARVLKRFPDEAYLIKAWYDYAEKFLSLKKKDFKGTTFQGKSASSPYMLEKGFYHLKGFISYFPAGELADDAQYECLKTRFKQKRYLGAARESALFINRYPHSAYLDDAYYYQMKAHFQQKKYKEAMESARVLVNKKFKKSKGKKARYSKHRTYALYLFGKIHHTRGQYGQAVEYYSRIKGKYADARRAYKFFTRKELHLPEYEIFGVDESPHLEVKYKNLSQASFQLYKVDLMVLFALKGKIQDFNKVDLTGIKAQKEWKAKLQSFNDYRVHSQKVEIPLPQKGAYLLVARVGGFEKTVILVKSEIQLQVQKDGGEITVYATERGKTTPLERVYVKISVGGRFVGEGFTDSRGVVTISTGRRGQISVLAEKKGEYGLFRSK